MQRKMLFAMWLVPSLASAPARADFAVERAGDPIVLAPQPSERVAAASPIQAPPYRVAKGFGKSVPLDFAVRQILPRGVTAQYGPSVDRSSPVNWTGGRPWDRVLAAAIQPLGLRMSTGTKTVMISR